MSDIYQAMDDRALDAEIARLEAEVAAFRAQGLSLDMARGKPSPAQTAISRPMLSVLDESSDLTDGGVDCSNYGCLEGIPSARRLAGEMLGVPAENTFVLGSSSLTVMHDVVAHLERKGALGGEPWGSRSGGTATKVLCPSPGYDRHFAITQDMGFENIYVPMTATGPDMDAVEALVASDPSVKAIWCVPKYSNPTGVTYSDETVRRLAAMPAAAPDFRILWDNAYCVHDLYDTGDELLNVFDAAREAGNADRVVAFASTSKITFPGAGIAFMASSPANLADFRGSLVPAMISADKLNQLRHARYLPDLAAVRAHMREHARFMRPRFEAVLAKLDEGLSGTGLGTWTRPRGGYFISFDGRPGTARRTVALLAEMGVKMTGAGATFPCGRDPRDSNIRIAPSYPSVPELEQGFEAFCLAVRLVAAQLERDGRGGRKEPA